MSAPTRKCPGCGRPFAAPSANPWRPFCSERCQLIDLGGWFGERHAIPGEPVPPEAEPKDPGQTP